MSFCILFGAILIYFVIFLQTESTRIARCWSSAQICLSQIGNGRICPSDKNDPAPTPSRCQVLFFNYFMHPTHEPTPYRVDFQIFHAPATWTLHMSGPFSNYFYGRTKEVTVLWFFACERWTSLLYFQKRVGIRFLFFVESSCFVVWGGATDRPP